MLGEVITIFWRAWLPTNMELSLCGTIADPIESHVDSAGFALFCCVVDGSFSGKVVCY